MRIHTRVRAHSMPISMRTANMRTCTVAYTHMQTCSPRCHVILRVHVRARECACAHNYRMSMGTGTPVPQRMQMQTSAAMHGRDAGPAYAPGYAPVHAPAVRMRLYMK